MAAESVPERTSESIVHVEDLSVSYGKITALRDVSMEIERGGVTGIIGPNGAGKSTFADTLAGFLDYSGTVTFQGEAVSDHGPHELVRMGMGYSTEARNLYGYMNVRDNLQMGAYHNRDNLEEQVEWVYSIFPALEERTEQLARTMSGGEQQMLAIGKALMGDPELLILDEPTIGLAPVIIENISEAIEEIRDEDVTILLCEQNVTFSFKHADLIYLLENGSIQQRGTPSDLKDEDYIQDVYLGA